MKKILMANELLLTEVGRLIAEGRDVTLTVTGNSMNPFFVDRRDQATLSPFRPEALKKGDVVLARETTGRIVFHRIVRREGDKLTLQGDGNIQLTERCTVADVLGLLTVAIRKGRSYPVGSRTWRCYSALWLWLTPLRRWPLALFRRLCL